MNKFTIYNLQLTIKSRTDRRPKIGNKKLESGMSLLEILIVVAIFALLGMIVTGSVVLSLQGSKKSESQLKASENLNYAMSVIERQIRNADSIPDCATNSDPYVLNYVDQGGDLTSFSCVGMNGADPYVASGSGRLTTSDVVVTACSFTCQESVSGSPPYIDISFGARSVLGTGVQGTILSSNTRIFLRSY